MLLKKNVFTELWCRIPNFNQIDIIHRNVAANCDTSHGRLNLVYKCSTSAPAKW